MISVKAVQAMKIESVVASLSMTAAPLMQSGNHGQDCAVDFFGSSTVR